MNSTEQRHDMKPSIAIALGQVVFIVTMLLIIDGRLCDDSDGWRYFKDANATASIGGMTIKFVSERIVQTKESSFNCQMLAFSNSALMGFILVEFVWVTRVWQHQVDKMTDTLAAPPNKSAASWNKICYDHVHIPTTILITVLAIAAWAFYLCIFLFDYRDHVENKNPRYWGEHNEHNHYLFTLLFFFTFMLLLFFMFSLYMVKPQNGTWGHVLRWTAFGLYILTLAVTFIFGWIALIKHDQHLLSHSIIFEYAVVMCLILIVIFTWGLVYKAINVVQVFLVPAKTQKMMCHGGSNADYTRLCEPILDKTTRRAHFQAPFQIKIEYYK